MMLGVFFALTLVILVFYQDEARSEGEVILCPSCSRQISSKFHFCPHCRFKMKSRCESCGNPVNWDWRQCPHCGNTSGEEQE